MDICQVEKEGNGMSGRGDRLAKSQRQGVWHKAGGTVAEVSRGQVKRILPARLRRWDLVLGEWGATEGV